MTQSAADTFLTSLEQSHLLDDEIPPWVGCEVERMRADRTLLDDAAAERFAARLVNEGCLTPWQVKMLLAGRKAFFLGRYKLLEHLGQGGMGAVFKAEHVSLKRIVALKLMAEKLVSDEAMLARFHREIQAAAALDHPNIVHAYDADNVGDTHFLVMEYVEGEDLANLVKRRGRLDVAEAANYCRQAALGLQHAHERGMVHRDVKPANLLLSVVSGQLSVVGAESSPALDRSQQPTTNNQQRTILKILDFGLARFTSETSETGELTATGQVMGTPDYISPEQSRNTHEADIRSDVYSLGCTLFYLLTGEVPFGGANAIERITARILEDAPRVRSRCADVPHELDAVVARMLRRDPVGRYQTPNDVAFALAPFAATDLDDRTFATQSAFHRAAPQSPEFEETLLSGQVAVGSDTFDGDAFDAGYSEFLKNLATEAELDERPDSEPVDALGEASSSEMVDPAAPGDSAAGLTRAGSKLRRRIEERKRADRRRLLYAVAGVTACVVIVAGFVFYQKSGETELVFDWPADERTAAQLSVDGRDERLGSSGDLRFPGPPGRRTARLFRKGYEPIELAWELNRGESKPIRPKWTPLPETVRALEWEKIESEVETALAAFAVDPPRFDDPAVAPLHASLFAFKDRWPEGEEVAAAAALHRRLPWPADALAREKIDSYELERAGRGDAADAPKELVAVLGDSRWKHWRNVTQVAFHPDGKTLASSGGDGAVRLWDVESGKETQAFDSGTVSAAYLTADFSPDGRWLACGSSAPKIIDARTGELRLQLEDTAYRVVFNSDGRLVATIGYLHVSVYDVATGERLARRNVPPHISKVADVHFSPEGETLLILDSEYLTWWEWRSGNDATRIPEGKPFDAENRTTSIALTPDWSLMAVGYGKTVEFWNPLKRERLRTIEQPDGQSRGLVALSRDGTQLATWDHSTPIVLDVETGRESVTLEPPFDRIASLAFSRDGKHIAAGSGTHCSIAVWDSATGKRLHGPGRHPGPCHDLAVTTDGRRIASTSVGNDLGGEVAVWDGADGSLWRWRNDAAGPHAVHAVFASAGRRLAYGDSSGRVHVYNFATGELETDPTGLLTAHVSGRVTAMDAHGGLVAFGGIYGPVVLMRADDLSKWEKIRDEKAVAAIAFHPDGGVIATAGDDSVIRFFDVEERRDFDPLKPGILANSLAWSPDGRMLAVMQNTEFAIYDFNTREELYRGRQPESRRGVLNALAYSPDGEYVAVAAPGAVFLWRPFPPKPKTAEERVAAAGRDPAEPVRMIRIGPPNAVIYRLRFTPEGRHLVTANGNGTVYILRL